eukprot:scaffold90737_cov28-Tisochrysis_lutea.AAC.1
MGRWQARRVPVEEPVRECSEGVVEDVLIESQRSLLGQVLVEQHVLGEEVDRWQAEARAAPLEHCSCELLLGLARLSELAERVVTRLLPRRPEPAYVP